LYPDGSFQQLEKLKESRRYFIEATSQSKGLKQAQAHYLAGRISEVLGDMPSRNFHYGYTLQLLYEHMQEFETVGGDHYRTSESALRGTQVGGALALFFPDFGLGFAATNGLMVWIQVVEKLSKRLFSKGFSEKPHFRYSQ
jgi:hypothetical protein